MVPKMWKAGGGLSVIDVEGRGALRQPEEVAGRNGVGCTMPVNCLQNSEPGSRDSSGACMTGRPWSRGCPSRSNRTRERYPDLPLISRPIESAAPACKKGHKILRREARGPVHLYVWFYLQCSPVYVVLATMVTCMCGSSYNGHLYVWLLLQWSPVYVVLATMVTCMCGSSYNGHLYVWFELQWSPVCVVLVTMVTCMCGSSNNGHLYVWF
ncbi:hypothetical protein MAR_009675 [Mya arenaria]|uniref:Uncharacterized protein n=1 Tax=Mya arenaria TaxID=6604 RepID=A0ABY7E2U5_MYAAR|nr:hypothetical protein MAR_009675 [Mya arenaria]